MISLASLSSVENLPADVMRRVTKEIVELKTEPPEGIQIFINEADLTDIQCAIEGPAETPYVGGSFRVKLVLPKDFPQSPPRGFFLTKIFHPNVATPSGEICVNTLKSDWKPNLGLKHILVTIRCLLIEPNPESALNEEAGRLLLENYDSYATRAKMMTEIHARPSRTTLNEAGPSGKRPANQQDTDGAAKKLKDNNKAKKMLKRL